MANRRNFLKHSSTLTPGTLLFPACSSENKNQTSETSDTTATTTTQTASANGNLGLVDLQLYSVKDVIEVDLKGVLQ